MPISKNALHVLHHTLGLTESRREPSRNHFVAGQGHHEMPALEELEEAGLMVRGRTPKFLNQQDIVFMCTEDGKSYAIENLPPEPKRTKYDEYLQAESSEEFAHFLGIRKPKFELRGSWRNFEYRMYRTTWGGDSYWRDVEGEWAATKKAAKASYKEALRRSKQREVAL